MSQPILGAIFDVDGTLVNSNDAHAMAWVAAIGESGFDVSLEQVRPLIGMGGDKLLPRLIGEAPDAALSRRIQARRSELFRERYLNDLRPFPKTRELFTRLRQLGFRLAIASSAKPEELSPLLELARVSDLVEVQTSSADAKHSKPDPDIVAAALRALDLPAHRVVMVGDTPYDIQSAAQLGIPTIALRSGGYGTQQLAGAVAVYDDVAQLLAHLRESPLARAAA